MPDKDQFTFDEEDDSPANSVGGRGTSSGEGPQDDFTQTDFNSYFPGGKPLASDSEAETPVPAAEGRGGSRLRLLLVILLLVVIGAAGAYYFMDLGETPTVSTVTVAPQPGTQSAPLSPQSASDKPGQEPTQKNVTVAILPPPPPAAAEKQQPSAQKQAGDQKAPPPSSEPVSPPTAAVKPAAAAGTAAAPPDNVTTAPSPTKSPQAAAGAGGYTLDAGSYLLDSNRKALVAKIKQMGFEPSVTPLKATLHMTRVRLGTYGRDKVKEALALARSIEPASYSTPAGDGYVIYAGTFLQRENVEKLSKRFAEQGIKVHSEPVQVVRTLSRIRFGQFATREDAVAKASELDAAGLHAEVVKAK